LLIDGRVAKEMDNPAFVSLQTNNRWLVRLLSGESAAKQKGKVKKYQLKRPLLEYDEGGEHDAITF